VKYGINNSSSGFWAVCYFKEILKKNISKSDIYGMALNSGIVKGGHYDNTECSNIRFNTTLVGDSPSATNLCLELKAMQDMF
jgi:hypothetical protein